MNSLQKGKKPPISPQSLKDSNMHKMLILNSITLREFFVSWCLGGKKIVFRVGSIMEGVLKKSFLILLVFCIGLSSCNDDPPDPPDNNEEKIPLIFESLTAEKDTIVSGETVVITAIASGKDIKYNWTATTGSILGSGHEITLTTTPCVPEEITVTCKVEDTYKESKTKTVLIVTL